MMVNPNSNTPALVCGIGENSSGFGNNPILPDGITATEQPAASQLVAPVETQEIILKVENSGYSPQVTHARAGILIKLTLVSQDVHSCSLAFVIPSLNQQVLLHPTGTYSIDIPAQTANSKLPFSCSMGMYTGVIIFDL